MSELPRTASDLLKHLAAIAAAVALSLAAMWFGGRPLPFDPQTVEPRPLDPRPDVRPLPHDPQIAGPDAPVAIGRLARFTLPEDVLDTAGHWRVVARSTSLADAAIVECDGGRTAFVETAAPCLYDVSTAGVKDGRVFHWATTFEVVAQPTPAPTPVPPQPTPEPEPVDVSPVKTSGFRVLLVYESEQGLPESFAAAAVREYLNERCAKGEDGRTPDWRCWDRNVDPTEDFAVWQAFWNVPRSSEPWIVVADGRRGFSGPAPVEPEKLLALLKKYGG